MRRSQRRPRRRRQEPRVTALWGLHKELEAKLTPFAGYEMPVQFEGVLAEHNHTREAAGLFDVSHMGQLFVQTTVENGGHEDVAAALEKVVPGDIKGLAPGQIRYTVLLNEDAGIVDDLMVTRPEGEANEGLLFLVVNASRKFDDFKFLNSRIGDKVEITKANDRALIALQGPKAAEVLARHAPFIADKKFMTATSCRIEGAECIVSRCGYTGEDGFEISLLNKDAEPLARKLLEHEEVKPIGLGARDSLRLEAGHCLYGADLNDRTSPVEAGLTWVIAKRRKMDKDFAGAEKIMGQVLEGPTRKRVGIQPAGKGPAREGTIIVNKEGETVGRITSGTFGPSVDGPIAMGYVDAAYAEDNTELRIVVRGRKRAARVVPMPFVASRARRSEDVSTELVVLLDTPFECEVPEEEQVAVVEEVQVEEAESKQEVTSEPEGDAEEAVDLSQGQNLTADDVMALFEISDAEGEALVQPVTIEGTAEEVVEEVAPEEDVAEESSDEEESPAEEDANDEEGDDT